MDMPSPGTRVRAKLKNFLSSKMKKGGEASEMQPAKVATPDAPAPGWSPGLGAESPEFKMLQQELEEEKRKRAMIAQEAASTEEVVRNALTAANARVEDVETRRVELSAELRAAQAASQIFETERFDLVKKLEDSRMEKTELEKKVQGLLETVAEL